MCTLATLGLLLQCVATTAEAQQANEAPNDPVAATDAPLPPVLRIEPRPEPIAEVVTAPASEETPAVVTPENGEPAYEPPPGPLAPEEPTREPPNASLIYAFSILGTGAVGALAFGLWSGSSCDDPNYCGMGVLLATAGGFALGALVGVGVGAGIYAVMSNSPERKPKGPVRVGLNASSDGAVLQLNGRF